MKKILSLLTAIILTIGGVSNVVACNILSNKTNPKVYLYKEYIRNFLLTSSTNGITSVLSHIDKTKFGNDQQLIKKVNYINLSKIKNDQYTYKVSINVLSMLGAKVENPIFYVVIGSNYMISYLNQHSVVLPTPWPDPGGSGSDVDFDNYLKANNYNNLTNFIKWSFNEDTISPDMVPNPGTRPQGAIDTSNTGFQVLYIIHNLERIKISIAWYVNSSSDTTMGLTFFGFYQNKLQKITINNLIKTI